MMIYSNDHIYLAHESVMWAGFRGNSFFAPFSISWDGLKLESSEGSLTRSHTSETVDAGSQLGLARHPRKERGKRREGGMEGENEHARWKMYCL